PSSAADAGDPFLQRVDFPHEPRPPALGRPFFLLGSDLRPRSGGAAEVVRIATAGGGNRDTLVGSRRDEGQTDKGGEQDDERLGDLARTVHFQDSFHGSDEFTSSRGYSHNKTNVKRFER